MEHIINRDYIGIIREINGFLEYNEENIVQDYILIEELDAMKNNPNRTIFDMQEILNKHYSKKINKIISYLYPYDYNTSYENNSAYYPRLISTLEYKNKIKTKRDELKKLHSSINEQYLNSNMSSYIFDLQKELKESFYKKAKKYIYASNYQEKKEAIKKDPNIKMYSTDSIGWSEFKYSINEDITIQIKTNFGYGKSSYFFCNLSYKDVAILPYSVLVKYFYANYWEIIRNTRSYEPKRESWYHVLHFVVENSNLAKSDPKKFLQKWVLDEVKEMIQGLKVIFDSPKESLEKHLNILQEKIDLGAYEFVIKSVQDNEVIQYSVFPNEKTIVFKAEKITGALLFLDNLKKFKDISPDIDRAISFIEEINLKIYDEIEYFINNLTIEINKSEVILNEIREEFKNIKEEEEHLNKIEEIINENSKKEDIIILSKEDKQRIKNEYINSTPDYKSLLDKKRDLYRNIESLTKEINMRENFYSLLKTCKKRIEKKLQAA
jgi:hypothetical protein